MRNRYSEELYYHNLKSQAPEKEKRRKNIIRLNPVFFRPDTRPSRSSCVLLRQACASPDKRRFSFPPCLFNEAASVRIMSRTVFCRFDPSSTDSLTTRQEPLGTALLPVRIHPGSRHATVEKRSGCLRSDTDTRGKMPSKEDCCGEAILLLWNAPARRLCGTI